MGVSRPHLDVPGGFHMSTVTQGQSETGRGLDVPYDITEEQVSCLHQDGWARLPGLLDDDAVRNVREIYASMATSPIVVGPDAKVVEAKNLLIHEGVSWENPEMLRIVTSRRLSTAITSLMRQPDALLAHDISIFKGPGSGGTGFHQDYSHQPLDRKGCLSFWIALEDLAPEMGPLWYLRGSHKEGPLGFIEPGEIRDRYPHLWDSEVVGGKAMKAGDAQAHWDLTVHGSGPNEGPGWRNAIAVRYMRSDTIYTGMSHPHFDKFDVKPGTRFADSGFFPRVTA